MGATSSVVTRKLDLRKKGLSYDTLYVSTHSFPAVTTPSWRISCKDSMLSHHAHIPRPRCGSEQHMSIVGPKALARIQQLYLCRNKLSALPPQLSVMLSLVDIRITDNWLKWLPEVNMHLFICMNLCMSIHVLHTHTRNVHTPSPVRACMCVCACKYMKLLGITCEGREKPPVHAKEALYQMFNRR